MKITYRLPKTTLFFSVVLYIFTCNLCCLPRLLIEFTFQISIYNLNFFMTTTPVYTSAKAMLSDFSIHDVVVKKFTENRGHLNYYFSNDFIEIEDITRR